MKITWSIPVRGERLDSGRGDLVRAAHLIEALRAEGHEVVVVEDAARPTTRAKVAVYRTGIRRLLPQRVALAVRDGARVLHARGHAGRVAAAAKAQGADVIVETQVHFAAAGARAARAVGVPLVLDDCSPLTEPAVLGAGLPSLARRVFRVQADRAAVLVASSPRIAVRLASDGVPVAKLRVVSNGVDADAYRRTDRAAVRARLRLADRVVVGFVGSFQPWHRVDLLVEALARLSPRPPLHLLLIGDGVGRRHALELARRSGLAERVTAPGAVSPEAVPELLAACDIGVLPATNGYGHPMKLMEYAAAGLATVAPDVPPARDVVDPEVTGLLFPPGDVAALGASIARLAVDLRLRRGLGTAARRRAGGASWRKRAQMLSTAIESAGPAAGVS